MSDPGFMIPLNARDYEFPSDGGARNICSAANEATYTQAPWYTCENIQLTVAGKVVQDPTVGTACVIQVGIQGLPAEGGDDTPAVVQNIQAWVCYPNTVAGQTSATLVVPSMQNNAFASYTATTATETVLFGNAAYQDPQGFSWFNLSAWTPSGEDFLEETAPGGPGHCCIIANAFGYSSVEDLSNPSESGEAVGTLITDNSQLSADINVCTSLWQAQRNIYILPASGGQIRPGGLAFLSGAPESREPLRTTVTASAINQGAQIDPVILKALSASPYAGFPLKPASSPPRSLRIARHECRPLAWLARIVREAEEIVEELLGLEAYPFGGGHQLLLTLPPNGLQPLRVDIELEPGEPPGTVHVINVMQTNADGTRGGIKVGVVVT